ncbi:suppressor of fused domain protein [Kineosporia sp. R_H_3]|uniref:suppressor of fused domain protein n=1 Tax=Kineosporia sp. R_H_3 TaxID=1961848 RepID=UPI000B4BF712|nr:suppressor of fused domain protein [Kineosporia sp. R_H_3]
MEVLAAVRELYVRRWGEPSRHAIFRAPDAEMEICKWDAAANDQGVDLYATLGASAQDLPAGGLGHRNEFFVGLRPGEDDVASALAALGLYSVRERVAVDHGDSVPCDGPLWPGTEMSSFLVMRQVGEILAPASLPSGVHVEFLQAIPLFESERRFKVAHGADALIRRWQSAGTAFWDPGRRPDPAS